MRFKRNHDKHTTAEQAMSNVLNYLAQFATSSTTCVSKATLGRAAFPEYDFKRPQGAAFAVAKIVRRLEDDGLVAYHIDDFRRGNYITPAGLALLVGAE